VVKCGGLEIGYSCGASPEASRILGRTPTPQDPDEYILGRTPAPQDPDEYM